jgi:GNAT superfamily N-acetyltransferase
VIAALVADLGYERPAADAAGALAAIGPDERVVVADVDGAVCGFASAAVVPFFHDGSRRLRLTAVAVTPSHRGRGVARSLIAALETWGRERGCSLVEVTSAERRVDAHAAYRALGFEEAPHRFTRRL